MAPLFQLAEPLRGRVRLSMPYFLLAEPWFLCWLCRSPSIGNDVQRILGNCLHPVPIGCSLGLFSFIWINGPKFFLTFYWYFLHFCHFFSWVFYGLCIHRLQTCIQDSYTLCSTCKTSTQNVLKTVGLCKGEYKQRYKSAQPWVRQWGGNGFIF